MNKTIELGPFESLPVITFRNTSLNEVHSWVLSTAERARECLRTLQEAKHIEVIFAGDATTKL